MSRPVEVRFVSGNRFKIEEAKSILGRVGISVVPAALSIAELQTAETEALVRDKLLKAFQQIGRPLFVEHTGLYLDRLNGLPGGLTQVFWDALQADTFAALFGVPPDNVAIAKTFIAYCDGQQIRIFSGEIRGRIAQVPRGPREFQWDPIFEPEGSTETFAEMGAKKNEISMRRVALDAFAKFLSEEVAR